MRTAFTCVLLAALVTTALGQDQKVYPQRWFYCSTNLLVDDNVTKTAQLAETAAKHGLNGMALADWKFNKLADMDKRYFANVARLRAACGKLGVDIIPCCFPIGYSSGLLIHDPNLAEGLPVAAAPFVVTDGVGRLVPDEAALPGGDFEQAPPRAGKFFPGVRWTDGPGVTVVQDREVFKQGHASARMQDFGKASDVGNCRIVWDVKLTPRRCYHIGGWVRTAGCTAAGNIRVEVLAEGRSLNYQYVGVGPTTDWKRFDLLVNSLDNRQASVYFGIWRGTAGRIWWDGLEMQEVGPVNALRREGAPLTVAGADGQTIYEEGRDFEPIPGPTDANYRWHTPHTIRLTKAGRIREGQRLAVSWFHPAVIYDGQVACCMSEPKVYELLDDQCRRVVELFEHPKWLFMEHDEIRTAGTDLACTRRGLTCGQILADNVKKCLAIARKHNPAGRVCVWSDMFDPTHNAKDKYYLCGSTFAGSWEGLDKDVVIVNWFGRPGSLEFFQKRGHKQIAAAYYDADLDQVRGWLKKLQPIDGAIGIMYTTWRNQYDDLAGFGDLVSGK